MMTTEQAINLLDQVLQGMNGTREAHARIMEAISVIKKALVKE